MSADEPGGCRPASQPFSVTPLKRVAVQYRRFRLILALLVFGAFPPRSGLAAPAASDFSAPPIDRSFEPGLAVVKRTSGLQEVKPLSTPTEWTPNLQMLIGFRCDVGSSRFVNLVEVTTLKPPAMDAKGQPVHLPEAKEKFSADWTNSLFAAPRVYSFTTPKYPVRVRIFDAQGRFLKESREQLSFGFLTNGLVEVCELMPKAGGFDFFDGVRKVSAFVAALTNAPPTMSVPPPIASGLSELKALWLHLERSLYRGLVALVPLFSEVQAAAALEEIRDHALEVVRFPNWLKAVVKMDLELTLNPQFEQATVLSAPRAEPGDVRVKFPTVLSQGKRPLAAVELIAGPTYGAYFLTAGVRAIRLSHPTKSDRRMLVQVLAVGVVPEPAAGSTTTKPQ